MNRMNKIERVDATLQGREVDRPAISFWYHFGLQHGGGERFADITLEYFNAYDLDFLKVMNDYYYPRPSGCDSVRTKEDLRRFARFDVEKSIWKEQLKALAIIGKALEGKAYFIDTMFDPFLSIKRHLAAENMGNLMENEPEALIQALEVVTENLIAYGRKALETGAAGIFMAIQATRESVTREQFSTFVKPFAKRVLEAFSKIGKMNTVHVHGEDLYMDDCLDLPAAVFNWWDRGPNGPSLQSVKGKTGACVMGGIDHTLATKRTAAFLQAHVKEGIEMGGKTRFFLANGCSIDTWADPGAVKAMVQAAQNDKSEYST